MSINVIGLVQPRIAAYLAGMPEELKDGPPYPSRAIRVERAHELIERLARQDILRANESDAKVDETEVLRVHNAAYLDRIKQSQNFAANATEPHEQYRWLDGGGDVRVCKNTMDAHLASFGAVREGVNLLKFGSADIVFVPTTPDHHARPDMGHGMCLLNGIAYAVVYAFEDAGFIAPATLDVDVHHGDGTAACLIDNPEVLVCSLHEGSTGFNRNKAKIFRGLFPNDTGAADKVGPHGNILNLPYIPLGVPVNHEEIMQLAQTPNDYEKKLYESVVVKNTRRMMRNEFWQLFNIAIERITDRQTDLLILPLGTDAHYLDPLSHAGLRVGSFYQMGQRMRQLAEGGMKILVLQQGGYHHEVRYRCHEAFLRGLAGKSQRALKIQLTP